VIGKSKDDAIAINEKVCIPRDLSTMGRDMLETIPRTPKRAFVVKPKYCEKYGNI
jgi:hypothetical protein